MRKSFKYRLCPNRTQAPALERLLAAHQTLYNAALEHRKTALEHRKTAWERGRVSVSYGQQSAELKDIRRDLDVLDGTSFSSCQATLRRLDKAFQAFFRRVKAGQSPAFRRRMPPRRSTCTASSWSVTRASRSW